MCSLPLKHLTYIREDQAFNICLQQSVLSFIIKYGVLKTPVQGISLMQVSEVSLSLSPTAFWSSLLLVLFKVYLVSQPYCT